MFVKTREREGRGRKRGVANEKLPSKTNMLRLLGATERHWGEGGTKDQKNEEESRSLLGPYADRGSFTMEYGGERERTKSERAKKKFLFFHL